MTTPAIISSLTDHVTEECSKIDLEQRFCDSLDQCYDFSSVGGPFAHMQASAVLREVDPIAYRCGMADYEDTEGLVEIDGDYYDKGDVESAVEEFVDGLKSELSDMEDTLEECQSQDEPDLEEVLRTEEAIRAKQAEIDACESHSF